MEDNYKNRLSCLSLDDGRRASSYSKRHDDHRRDSISVYSDICMESDYRRYTLPSDTQLQTNMPSWMSTDNIPTPTTSRSNSKSSKSSQSSIISEDSITPISPTASNYSSTPVTVSKHQRSVSSDPSMAHLNHPPPRTTSLNYNLHHHHTTSQFTDNTNDYSNVVNRSQSDPLHKKKKTILPIITRLKQSAEAHFGKYKPLDPPEPPKQLLIPSLFIEENKIAPFDGSSPSSSSSFPCLSQQQQKQYHQQDIKTQSVPSSSSSLTPSSTSSLKISTTLNNNNNNSCPTSLRRRSSCPSKSIEQIKKNETQLPSPTPSTSSSISSTSTSTTSNATTLKKKRESYNTPSSPRPPCSSLAIDMMWATPSSTSLSEHKHHLEDIYDDKNDLILSFTQMKPRSVPLKRKTCSKREKKVLSVWHDSLVDLLNKEEYTKQNISNINHMAPDKREKYALTRKFILREIYLTEVTFWNQLYYTKVMFYDIMKSCLQRNSPFIRESDLDLMSNLPDLMQCSSKLIRKITPYLENPTCPESMKSFRSDDENKDTSDYQSKRTSNSSQHSTTSTLSDYSTMNPSSPAISPVSSHSSTTSSSTTTSFNDNNGGSSRLLPLHLNADARYLPVPSDQTLIGKHICDMAEHFVVYLRCALDYKYNRKKVDQRLQHNKGFAAYQEKLSKNKETSQFYVTDYFIIPIQRITRYGLLLADLEKHTSRDHPDYKYIRRARLIMTSLAVAMNKAQR